MKVLQQDTCAFSYLLRMDQGGYNGRLEARTTTDSLAIPNKEFQTAINGRKNMCNNVTLEALNQM